MKPISDTWSAWRPWLEERAAEVQASILFLTRIPFARQTPTAATAVAQAAWAFPVAGLIVGIIGAVIYALAHRLGLPAWPAAALAVAATLAATGCLHEDGLADAADGFGGGATREQKLDIMRDARTGVFGVSVLVLSILIRVAALASLADTSLVVPALIAAHGAARATMPILMFLLPPARGDGLAFAVGRPPGAAVGTGAAIGFLILAICLGVTPAIVAAVLLAIVTAFVGWLSAREIGGQSGDVLGALEQIGEIAVVLVAVR
jgi:adenosylcobinamide-GDP ribazoletransferase